MRFDDLDPANRQKAADAFRATVVRNAIHHLGDAPFQSIDPFSASILESRGMLMATQNARSMSEVVAILGSSDTKNRLANETGPYILLKGTDRSSMIDPSELLADPVGSHRMAGLKYFEELPADFLASSSRRQIEEARSAIASSNRAEWFPAAKGIYDSLRADVYLTLAGFSQCYTFAFEHGVNQFLANLLRPNTQILSSIDIDYFNPSDDYTNARIFITKLSELPTLKEAINEYYYQFGHIPLCGPIGLGEILRRRSEDHNKEKCWDTIWDWADECQSPIARYHACVACLANPSLVPAGVEDFLWGEIGDIVNLYSEGVTRTRWVEAWMVRNELAQHFANYLECLLPGMDGERLMVTAWWMTERICERLPQSPGLLAKLRNTTIAGELQRSRFMNDLTHPPIGPSSLRYMTKLMPRVWAASVLCELGDAQWLFDRVAPSREVGHAIDTSLTSLLILGYPRPLNASPRAVYAFERCLGPTATAWAKITNDQQSAIDNSEMTITLQVAEEASSRRALPVLVHDLAAEQSEKDLRSADFIRQLVHFDPAASEPLWNLFCESNHYIAVFHNASSEALVILFQALTELQVQQGGKWRLTLAHLFAQAATEAKQAERQELLFKFTVFASIHAGGVSAVDRLMHSPCRPEFAKLAGEWHDQLIQSMRGFTPWSAAQIRAVLPSLVLNELANSI